jgi:hypothetical protein
MYPRLTEKNQISFLESYFLYLHSLYNGNDRVGAAFLLEGKIMYVFFVCDKIVCGLTSYRVFEDDTVSNDDTCDHCGERIHEPLYNPHIDPSITEEQEE